MDRRSAIKTILKALAVAPLGALLPGLMGCAPPEASPAPGADPPRPVRIAIFIDKTGSVHRNGIEQPSVDDLLPLIDVLGVAGGELAVGGITANSDNALSRLRVSSPPEAPVAPDEDGNIFELDEKLNEYAVQMTAHRTALEAWTDDAVERSEHFLDNVKLFLETPPNARYTDIFNAVRRGDRMLAEPVVGREPLRFIVIVSDCENNVATEPAVLTVPIQVAVVHGAKGIGDLASLAPKSFESFAACVRWIVETVAESEGS